MEFVWKPEHAARTLHDSSVHFLHCVRNNPLQSLTGVMTVLVGYLLNFALDTIIVGVEVWGVWQPELLGPSRVHVLPAPPLRPLLHFRMSSLAGRHIQLLQSFPGSRTERLSPEPVGTQLGRLFLFCRATMSCLPRPAPGAVAEPLAFSSF